MVTLGVACGRQDSSELSVNVSIRIKQRVLVHRPAWGVQTFERLVWRSGAYAGRLNLTLVPLLTKKYFCEVKVITAVHLVSSSFLGFRGFMDLNPQRLIGISRATASGKSITAMA